MALECVLNNDTQQTTEGEKKSDEVSFEEDPADLEEGEILDSGGEDEIPSFENPEFTAKHQEQVKFEEPNEFKEALPSDTSSKKKRKKKKKRKGTSNEEENKSDNKPKRVKYVDHDQVKDDNIYFKRSPSPGKRIRQARYISPSKSPRYNLDSNESGESEQEEGSDMFHDIDERRPMRPFSNKHKQRGSSTARRPPNSSRNKSTNLKRKRPNNNVDTKRNKGLPRNRREPRAKAVCKFYLDGKCLKGDECQYSHDVTPYKKKDICKFFLNGFCAKGDTCLYMHGDFPCKFFHTTGKCYFETGCRFSHEPLTDEMKRILDRHLETTSQEEEAIIQEHSSPARTKPRPSLLGSPPRHVKEQAEEWQNDLLQRGRYRGNKRGFQEGNGSRGNFSRPNFYVETLSRSPAKMSGMQPMMPENEMNDWGPENEWCNDEWGPDDNEWGPQTGDMDRGPGDMDGLPDMGGPDMMSGNLQEMGRPMGGPNMNDMGRPNMGGPNRNDMGRPMGGPNMNDMSGPNMNDMGRSMGGPNMNDMGRPNMNDMGRLNMNDMGRPNMNDMGRPNMSNMGRPNMNDMGRPNMNDMGRPNMNDMGRVDMGRPIMNDMARPMSGPNMNDMGRPLGGPNTNDMGKGPPNMMQGPFFNSMGLTDNLGPSGDNAALPSDEDSKMNNYRSKGGSDYDEDLDDIVVAGEPNNPQDDILSERIREIKAQSLIAKPVASSENANPDDSESQSTVLSHSPTQVDENSSDIIVPKVPIAIPVHLPRRQRELFLRIQQHQKRAANSALRAGEAGENSDSQGENNTSLTEDEKEVETKEPEEKPEVKEEEEYNEDYDCETEDEDKEKWYSSDEDDDDNGDQLTAVLKKLQEKPPPERSQSTGKPEKLPITIDINKMLNNIRQQATQGSGTFSSNQSDFWQNILSATIPFQGSSGSPPINNPAPPRMNQPLTINQTRRHMPRMQFGVPPQRMMHRSMLPPVINPQLPPHLQGQFQQPSKLVDGPAGVRDPRFRGDMKKPGEPEPKKLNARDPRLTRDPRKAPPPVKEPKLAAQPKPQGHLLKSPSPPHHHHPPNPTKMKERRTSSTEKHFEGDKKSGSSSYRLHLVTVSPLNYSSYLFAIQNNTKLLSDPRLKKLLENQKTSPVFNKQSLPFPPELSEMLKLDATPREAPSKPEVLKVPRPTGNVAKALQEIRAATAQRKAAANIRSVAAAAAAVKDTNEGTPPYSGAKTPPYTETGSTPPYISGTPPYIGSPEQSTTFAEPQAKPIISHLPRSVTDPRLARLHQPTRSSTVTKKKVPVAPATATKDEKEIEEIKSPDPVSRRSSNEEEVPVKGNSKNRKGSLDYASPLNAYSDSTNKTSNYNSYNRRPPTQARPELVTKDPVNNIPLNVPEIKDMPDFVDEASAINQSLKEVFKTIDPTASPFC